MNLTEAELAWVREYAEAQQLGMVLRLLDEVERLRAELRWTWENMERYHDPGCLHRVQEEPPVYDERACDCESGRHYLAIRTLLGEEEP